MQPDDDRLIERLGAALAAAPGMPTATELARFRAALASPSLTLEATAPPDVIELAPAIYEVPAIEPGRQLAPDTTLRDAANRVVALLRAGTADAERLAEATGRLRIEIAGLTDGTQRDATSWARDVLAQAAELLLALPPLPRRSAPA